MFDSTNLDISFLVRSKADPRDFWHVPGRGPHSGTLLVSRADRTRFRITARDAPVPLNGSPIIMISSDAIEIAEAKTGRVVEVNSRGYLALRAPTSGVGTLDQLVVEERADASEQLVIEELGEETLEPGQEVILKGHQQPNAQIYFRDLKTRFSALSEDGDKSVARRLEAGDGEEWELV